jgi:sulfide:quinone oxidoreductase
MPTHDRFNVVIAGGGVAALEAALALRELAGDRVSVKLVAPEAEFVYRPTTVGEPFARPSARRYPVEDLAREVGAELIADRLTRVDAPARTAHTEQGRELPYDALVIATGARVRAPFAHGLTVDDHSMDRLLHGIVQDVEGGYLHSLAFVAPERIGWPLPIYELALMTAERAYAMNVEVAVSIVTPEGAPLELFGEAASRGVGQLLEEAGITTICGVRPAVPEEGLIVMQPGDRRLRADRVIALPELFGPSIRGLAAGAHAFLPVDSYGQVHGLSRVFAAGDATDFPVKHGSMAAQQADAVARSIAVLAGSSMVPEPFRPRIHGVLFTGGAPKYITAQLVGGRPLNSQFTDAPTWGPGAKIAATYLAPYLERCDHAPALA